MVSSLDQVLSYRNPDVVARFRDDNDCTEEEAEDVFRETLKWLWLCAHSQDRSFQLPIIDATRIIDEMWHAFILHTVDYSRFCHRYFGRYIHHAPSTHAEKAVAVQKAVANPRAARRDRERELTRLVSYVTDVLGVATAVKWYRTYPRRFNQRPPSANSGP
jgi:hypothetical protein